MFSQHYSLKIDPFWFPAFKIPRIRPFLSQLTVTLTLAGEFVKNLKQKYPHLVDERQLIVLTTVALIKLFPEIKLSNPFMCLLSKIFLNVFKA
jgi:hypothetical protein